MDALAIIAAYRNASSDDHLNEYYRSFSFHPVADPNGTTEDKNLDFRTELTEALLTIFTLSDIRLIRHLFREELECEASIGRHDNLYQLSYYLYSLGQLEDTFVLYESKYGLQHMDSSTMQDQYFITVGHEPAIVIEYVLQQFQRDPSLEEKYPELITELEDIRDNQEYGTVEEYSKFIRGYFFGHEDDTKADAHTA